MCTWVCEDGKRGRQRDGRNIKYCLEVWGLGHLLQSGYSKVCTLEGVTPVLWPKVTVMTAMKSEGLSS